MTTRYLFSMLLFAAIAATGCATDTPTGTPTDSTAAIAAPSLALELSDSSGVAGREILVYGQFSGPQGAVPPASFAAAVSYDPAALRYVSDAPVDGAMSAVNAGTAGLVRVAGAAPDGFADGRLFVLRFRTLRRDAARTLALDVPQLGTKAFHNALPNVTLRRSVEWSTK